MDNNQIIIEKKPGYPIFKIEVGTNIFYFEIKSDCVHISLGESFPIEDQHRYKLNIRTNDVNQLSADIIQYSKEVVTRDKLWFEFELNKDKYYLSQLFNKKNIILKENKAKNDKTIKNDNITKWEKFAIQTFLSFLFLFVLDEILAKSFGKLQNSVVYVDFITKFSKSYLGDFLIKRMKFYKYKDSKSTEPYRAAVNEYYWLLIDNKLEDHYPVNYISSEISLWFTNPEKEIIKVIPHIDYINNEQY